MILVVEDAAQAMGGRSWRSPSLGTIGDVSIVWARGKNMTPWVRRNHSEPAPLRLRTRSKRNTRVCQKPWLDVVRNWLELLVMRIFIHPALYWLPAGLPFPRVG